ncbi:hypothetical protein ACWDWV_32825 [Streptosporangium sandarakinum]
MTTHTTYPDTASPIEAARGCLAAGGTLTQALQTLARVAARATGDDAAYPLLYDEVAAAVRGRSPGPVAGDALLSGLNDDAQRKVLDVLAETFPLAHRIWSADYCAVANRSAVFLPATGDRTRPCMSVAGVLAFIYLDPDTRTIRLSGHLDSPWDELLRADGTVPLRGTVDGMIVFDGSDQARATGATVPAPLPGIADAFTSEELECLVRTVGEAAGGGNALDHGTLSARQLELAERAYALLMADLAGQDPSTLRTCP